MTRPGEREPTPPPHGRLPPRRPGYRPLAPLSRKKGAATADVPPAGDVRELERGGAAAAGVRAILKDGCAGARRATAAGALVYAARGSTCARADGAESSPRAKVDKQLLGDGVVVRPRELHRPHEARGRRWLGGKTVDETHAKVRFRERKDMVLRSAVCAAVIGLRSVDSSVGAPGDDEADAMFTNTPDACARGGTNIGKATLVFNNCSVRYLDQDLCHWGHDIRSRPRTLLPS